MASNFSDAQAAALAGNQGAVAAALFSQMDNARRLQGNVMDVFGLRPQETPSRVVMSSPLLTLKAYQEPDSRAEGPVMLLVPAPIKRAYIWDLMPQVSVVQQCLRRGGKVYLVQWEPPSESEQEIGLAGYADHAILTCLDAIEAEAGESRAVLLGHSLGGTLAAIFAALHPQRVLGLVLLGAPLHFGPDAGALDSVVASSAASRELPAGLGNLPGSFLTAASVMASPDTFLTDRLTDLLGSLTDPDALRTHLLVERWTLDEMPLSRQFFDEVIELLYREDCLTQGTLLVGDHPARPQQITAPLLNVVEPKSRIVPPTAVEPFHEVTASRERQILNYPGDRGVGLQHVGMLTGRYAHEHLWPEILDWVHEHASNSSRPPRLQS